MTRPPSAAAALYPHLKAGTPDVVQQRQQGTVADAMYPALSREARQQALEKQRAQAELKARNKRLADHLQETLDAVRREKAGR
jgi:hypothetical protein